MSPNEQPQHHRQDEGTKGESYSRIAKEMRIHVQAIRRSSRSLREIPVNVEVAERKTEQSNGLTEFEQIISDSLLNTGDNHGSKRSISFHESIDVKDLEANDAKGGKDGSSSLIKTVNMTGDVVYTGSSSSLLSSNLKKNKPPSTSSIRNAKKKVSERTKKGFIKLFGKDYDSKEATYVLFAGMLMAFNSGFLSGIGFSGLISPTEATAGISGTTGAWTKGALNMARGNWTAYSYETGLVMSYVGGSFLSGFITPEATPYQLEPTYGPTFLMGGFFLLASALCATFETRPSLIFFCATAANGIQNSIASIYSANLIRCTMTGVTTDLALVFGQWARGNKKNLPKGFVLLTITINFFMGGFVSFYATRQFLKYTLYFNAALFWIVGISLIYFLVRVVGVSWQAAIFGTWKWKKTMAKLKKKSSESGTELAKMFDEIDSNENALIEKDELFTAMIKSGYKVKLKDVQILMDHADANGDGAIDREEWKAICAKIESSLH